MHKEKSSNAIWVEANTFVSMHLNETGRVEDFIDILKKEMSDFDNERKAEYLRCVINKIKEESAWHNNVCSLKSCRVKTYFQECLKILEQLSDENLKKN
jgi:hypothetical protein